MVQKWLCGHNRNCTGLQSAMHMAQKVRICVHVAIQVLPQPHLFLSGGPLRQNMLSTYLYHCLVRLWQAIGMSLLAFHTTKSIFQHLLLVHLWCRPWVALPASFKS